MKVTTFRIDDRLIHGQIVTAWLSHAEAKTIVVADDKAVKDSLQQSLLKMATPRGIKLHVVSVEDAIDLLKNDDTTTNALLLVRGPESALRIVKEIPSFSDINVGNMNMKKGKIKVLDNLWVFEEEVNQLKELSKLVELEVRAVPSDRKQMVNKLLEK